LPHVWCFCLRLFKNKAGKKMFNGKCTIFVVAYGIYQFIELKKVWFVFIFLVI